MWRRRSPVPYSAVFAAGVQGAYNPTHTAGSQEYISSETFTLNGSTMSGHLILGLLDTQAFGSGFTSLAFTVTVGGVTDVSQTFSTLAAAKAYFANDAVDLGTFSSTNGLAVGIKFDMIASAAGVGFGQDFILGATDGNAPPVISAPTMAVVQQGQTNAIAGVKVGEANALPSGQTVTVTLADASGLLAVTANGATVGGENSTKLSVTGTVAQVDAALASLTDTSSVLGADTITLNATDTRGGYAAPVTIGVSVNGAPAITVGGAQVLTQNHATAIAGVSVSDPDAVGVGETLTVTMADTRRPAQRHRNRRFGRRHHQPDDHRLARSGERRSRHPHRHRGDGRDRHHHLQRQRRPGRRRDAADRRPDDQRHAGALGADHRDDRPEPELGDRRRQPRGSRSHRRRELHRHLERRLRPAVGDRERRLAAPAPPA